MLWYLYNLIFFLHSSKYFYYFLEHPVFLQKLDETTSMSRRTGRMQCCVTGLPYPKIKWFRDWHPLYESERIKILWEEPDKCTLFISNLITRDNALYSCTATNIAGTATSSAILNVVGKFRVTFLIQNYIQVLTFKGSLNVTTNLFAK